MKAYGNGKSVYIHREVQTPYDPDAEVQVKEIEERARKTKPVTVTDMETGESTDYPSVMEAAEAIGCKMDTVSQRINGRVLSPIFKRYTVSRKEES